MQTSIHLPKRDDQIEEHLNKFQLESNDDLLRELGDVYKIIGINHQEPENLKVSVLENFKAFILGFVNKQSIIGLGLAAAFYLVLRYINI